MGDNREKRDQGRRRVLAGHKKVGSKFIPPALQHIRFNELSYVRDLLPEVTWIALANRLLGFQDGAALCMMTVGAASDATRPGRGPIFVNFALLSSYQNVDRSEVERFTGRLSANGGLHTLQEVVEPLTELIPQFPLAFIGLPGSRRDRSALVEELRQCVKELLDRESPAATAAQAFVSHARYSTGGAFYAAQVQLPNFKAAMETPGSEDAARDSGRIRATVLSEIMMVDAEKQRTWPREFWNRALRVDDCTTWEPPDEP